MLKLIGPFSEILTFHKIPLRGALRDEDHIIIKNGGILVRDGRIVKVARFKNLLSSLQSVPYEVHYLEKETVVLPGFIDSHTHICFAGSRARDYSLRNGGMSYLEIAKSGGGIWDTVTATRNASTDELAMSIQERIKKQIDNGITTTEVKSGYGLSTIEELKLLRCIKKVGEESSIDIISTCLAAHIKPRDFDGSNSKYLKTISDDLFPLLKSEKLTNRIDAFVEKEAFTVSEARSFYRRAQELGFDLTMHADQFTVGGSALAVEMNARSADHLEASSDIEIELFAKSETVATILPGASIGLGCGFGPARKLLDKGAIVSIASDWNPGSAPMGDLLTQAAILGCYEKLSATEVFAGITCRAAHSLNLADRGRIVKKAIADFTVFPTNDYREILYHQGQLKPCQVWKKGDLLFSN